MSRLHIITAALLLPLFPTGCDSGVMSAPDSSSSTALTLLDTAIISNGHLSARSGDAGGLSNLGVIDSSGTETRALTGTAGIWLAAGTQPVTASTAGLTSFLFRPATLLNNSAGYLVVTRDSLSGPVSNWPSELGAPTTPTGVPKMYGDVMSWSLFQPDSLGVSPVGDVVIGATTYLFKDGELSRAAFHRYDVINTGSNVISNLHIGYGADMDINVFGQQMGAECETLTHHENQMGLDLERFLNYVFMSPHPEDGDLPARCYGTASAFAVLPMHADGGMGERRLANRIYRRNDPRSIYSEFHGGLFTTPATVLLALQGFSALGNPMINPVTGAETKFAFTGDPVEGTGWLDERNDGRQLVSMEPIYLAPGERASITTVWLYSDRDTLEEALQEIKSRYDLILSRRELWDY